MSAGNIWYVGSGPGNHTASIQDAIDNYANDGDTVFVHSGTYYENVFIDKSINLTGENRDTTIIDGGGNEDAIEIAANWVNITGFTMTNVGSNYFDSGIEIRSSFQFHAIFGNNFLSNNGSGIFLYGSSHATITDNNMSYNDNGIYLAWSSNNYITNNVFLNNGRGIFLSYASNNNISDNYFSNNIFHYENGNILDKSSNNILTYNTFINDGILITGDQLSHFNSHSISTSNTVNGNPLYYIKDSLNMNIDGIPVGQLILANCSGFDVRNLHINDTCAGIEIAFSTDIIITNNNVSSNSRYGIFLRLSSYHNITHNTVFSNGDDTGDCGIFLDDALNNYIGNNNLLFSNRYGIWLRWSLNNTIANNNILNNFENGIYFWPGSSNNTISNNIISSNLVNGIRFRSSSNNRITNNYISNNGGGIILGSGPSNNNTITNNIVLNNTWGIALWSPGSPLSFNNMVYHNNIIDNINQAIDDTNNGNQWGNYYPLGGNYWSDFDEPSEGAYDDYQGPNQNIIGSDGIVDNGFIGGGGRNPYVIDSDSQDNYPLINPLDNWPPIITNLQPPDGSTTNDNTPTISADYSDPSGINVSSVVLIVDGIDVTSSATVTASGVSYIPGMVLSDGIHTVYLEVKDNVGYLATASWSFTVDTIPPTITNLQPPDLSTTNDNIPTISADYSDPSGIDVSSVLLEVDGIDATSSAVISGSGVSYIPGIALSDGIHIVYVEVKDSVGNLATETWSFTVDTALPPITNLTTKVVNNGNNVELEWDPPSSLILDHYLIYRADSATEFDFSTPHNISTTWPNPKNFTWIDPDPSVTAVDDDFYYIVRAANFDESIVSLTSNTAGVWTRTFESGISTFSLPLEPFVKKDTEYYCQDMNASYIKWMNQTTHTWMRHDKGSSENNTLVKVGEGYEIGFLGKSTQTRFTFTGFPGAMILYDNISFGFDATPLTGDADSLTATADNGGNITLNWTLPKNIGSGDQYSVLRSTSRDGFWGTLGVNYTQLAVLSFNVLSYQDIGNATAGTEYYYMIVPVNLSTGERGVSSYSIGVWTAGYLAQYDTVGIPLKLSSDRTADWYCDNIPDTVGINYYIYSEQRWGWHSTRMPAGAYDPLLVMAEGYQISSSGATKFMFIGQ